MPPFENHVPLVLTAYYKLFLKVCPKLDPMTHFDFHGNCFRCFLGGSKLFFYKNLKPKTLHKWHYFWYLMKVKELKQLCASI